MDPDECLKQIREQLAVWSTAIGEREMNAAAFRIAELTLALDEWMSKGGFMPTAWWSAKIQLIRNEVTGAS